MSRGSRDTRVGFSPPKSLTATLLEQLVNDIDAGRLETGERLPTEREMVATYGVSKTVVRETVAVLRSRGYVTTRHGVGSFVSEPGSRGTFTIEPEYVASITQVLNVLQLRLAIEVEAAAIAAETASDEDLEIIASALRAFDADIENGNLAIESDMRFHRAIIRATGNPLFVKIFDSLGTHSIPRSEISKIEPLGFMFYEHQKSYLEKLQRQHKATFNAIANRNPNQARSAIRVHITDSISQYCKRLDEQACSRGTSPEGSSSRKKRRMTS